MKKCLALPLLILTLSTPAVAQEKPVDELFRVMSMDKQISGGFEAMLPVIDQMSARLKLDTQGNEELKNIFRTWFNEDVDLKSMEEKTKQLYSHNFTSDELHEVTKFYQSPTGQKFLEKSSQLMQAGVQIGMQETKAKEPQLMERLRPFIEKYGPQK